MSQPKCPKCSIFLKPYAINDLKYLSCKSCDGHFASLFNLNKSIKNSTVLELWHQSATAPFDNASICPSCVKPMKVFDFKPIHTSTPLEVDLCRPCKSIWLDNSESQQLTSPDGSKAPKINLPNSSDITTAIAEHHGKHTHFQHTRAPGGLNTLITLLGLPVDSPGQAQGPYRYSSKRS